MPVSHPASWSRRLVSALAAAVLATVALPGAADGQAFNYPSLQIPKASTRDYTAALVGGAGTTALFQWREGLASDMHWQLDAGLADPEGGADPLLFVGVGFAKELLRATGDQPLDLLFTAGAGAAFGGDGSVLRIPFGVSLGHTFDLDQGMAITPYLHPRASVDVCSRCGRGRDSRSTVSLNFDLGAEWRVNRQFAVIGAVAFSGSDAIPDDDTFALGLRWTPGSLQRR